MTRTEADGRSEPDAVLDVCVLVGFSLKASERDFIALLVDLYCAFSSTLSRAFSSVSSYKNSIFFFSVELLLSMTREEADGRSEPDAVLNVCILICFLLKASERDSTITVVLHVLFVGTDLTFI
ncbi:unnamed protein product [Musa hybrid cultivar]